MNKIPFNAGFRSALAFLCLFSLPAKSSDTASANTSSSGVYGDSLIGAFSAESGNYPASDYDLLIQNATNGKNLRKFRTKDNGDFTIALPAGRYLITPVPDIGRNSIGGNPASYQIEVGDQNTTWFRKTAKVTVWKGFHTKVSVFFEQ